MAIDPELGGSAEQPKTDDEGVLDKVARTIGKASGVVVAAASRVLPNSEPEKQPAVTAKSSARDSLACSLFNRSIQTIGKEPTRMGSTVIDKVEYL